MIRRHENALHITHMSCLFDFLVCRQNKAERTRNCTASRGVDLKHKRIRYRKTFRAGLDLDKKKREKKKDVYSSRECLQSGEFGRSLRLTEEN